MKKSIKRLQALWPVWFPYPSAWLNVFLVALLMFPLMLWASRLAVGTLTVSSSTPFFIALGVGVPFVLYAYLYSFFWGDSPEGWPRRVPSPKSLWEAFCGMSITVISFQVAAAISLLFGLHKHYTTTQDMTRDGLVSASIWLVVALYLYHAKVFVWRGIIGELEEKARGDEAAGLPPRYRLGKTVAAKSKVKSRRDDPFGEFKP